jgi:hypothetical protein
LFSGADNDSFLLDEGVYRRIELPGATSTVANAINNRGEIAGSYADSGGTWHGLLRDRKGRYVSIDHPDEARLGTTLYSINDRGETTGAYQRIVEQPDPGPAAALDTCRGDRPTVPPPRADRMSWRHGRT